MTEQITPIPDQDVVPQPDIGEVSKQIDQERARHYGSVVLGGVELGEKFGALPQAKPKSAEEQLKDLQTEMAWKEVEAPAPDATAMQAQTDEAWQLHEGKKALKQLEDEKAARLDAELETEEHIKESMMDQLTGLPNREGFLQEANTMFGNNREGFVLAFADLDGFKAINDKLGHRVGDEVLKEVSGKLKAKITDKGLGTVGRFGGDEFVIALNNAWDEKEVEKLFDEAKKDIESIAKTSQSGDITLHAGVSIGRVRGSEINDIEHDGLGRADELMYEVKQANRPEGYKGRE